MPKERETVELLRKRNKALQAANTDLAKRFKKRTIAYGIAKRESDKNGKDVLYEKRLNKYFTAGVILITNHLEELEKETCDSCREKVVQALDMIRGLSANVTKLTLQEMDIDTVKKVHKILGERDMTDEDFESLLDDE